KPLPRRCWQYSRNGSSIAGTNSTSTAPAFRLAIPLLPPGPAFSPPCCTKCNGVTRATAWKRCVSVVARVWQPFLSAGRGQSGRGGDGWVWSSSHSGVVLQEPGPSVDQEATQRLRTALWGQRVEALRHTHARDKRDGTYGKGRRDATLPA